MTEATQLPEPGPFGDCPECGRNDGYRNLYKDHWFICHEHKNRWFAGMNLFSSWVHESEEHWAANEELLVGYKEVEPWIRVQVVEPLPEPPRPPRVPQQDDIGDTARGSDTIEIRVEYHPPLRYSIEDCVMCGNKPSMGLAVPVAKLPSGGSGEVCYKCIEAGPEGMKQRITEHAKRLRAWAEEFERWAQGDIKAPSIDDVRKVERSHIEGLPSKFDEDLDDTPF